MTMPTMNSGSKGYTPSFNVGKSKGGYRPASLQQFTPEMMQLFGQLFGNVGPDSYLGKLAAGDQSQFEDIEAPAWRDFQQAQGQTASRFSQQAPGAMSARRGSGFQNTMNQASADFASNLKAQRMGIQMEAIDKLREFSQMLLGQHPYENQIIKKDPSFIKQIGMAAMNQGAQFASTAGNAAIKGAMA